MQFLRSNRWQITKIIKYFTFQIRTRIILSHHEPYQAKAGTNQLQFVAHSLSKKRKKEGRPLRPLGPLGPLGPPFVGGTTVRRDSAGPAWRPHRCRPRTSNPARPYGPDPMAPRAPGAPRAPRAPSAPRAPWAPRAFGAPKAPRAPTATRAPKAPRAPRGPRGP